MASGARAPNPSTTVAAVAGRYSSPAGGSLSPGRGVGPPLTVVGGPVSLRRPARPGLNSAIVDREPALLLTAVRGVLASGRGRSRSSTPWRAQASTRYQGAGHPVANPTSLAALDGRRGGRNRSPTPSGSTTSFGHLGRRSPHNDAGTEELGSRIRTPGQSEPSMSSPMRLTRDRGQSVAQVALPSQIPVEVSRVARGPLWEAAQSGVRCCTSSLLSTSRRLQPPEPTHRSVSRLSWPPQNRPSRTAGRADGAGARAHQLLTGYAAGTRRVVDHHGERPRPFARGAQAPT